MIRRTMPRARHARAHPARPFAMALLLLSALALFGYLRDARAGVDTVLATRSLSALEKEQGPSGECRNVRSAKDQCAHVRANCSDEEAGLFSYLQLYYCTLGDAKLAGFFVITTWAAMLFTTIGVAASDFFCINLSTIAAILGMSESMAGVTFLAFGNGSPDVFSTFAAMSSNSGSLAIGELIGAASFITAVVAASMAFVRPFKVARRSFVRDVLFFIVAICFSMYFLANGKLELWESIVMVAFYIFYVIVVVSWHWILSKRKARRELEAAARAHYSQVYGEQDEQDRIPEDLDDADVGSRRSASFPLIVTDDHFRDLEHADYEASASFDDLEEEEAREQWMGELSNNMRVTRPAPGRMRSTTVTPIRPSLVGALEFQSVLASLKKSRNIQTMPIHLRRYSDDPNFTAAQQQANQQAANNFDEEVLRDPFVDAEGPRGRDTNHLAVHDGNLRTRAMTFDNAMPTVSAPAAPDIAARMDGLGSDAVEWQNERPIGTTLAVHSPHLKISPPPSDTGPSRDSSPNPLRSRASTLRSDGYLAPPEAHGHRRFLSESGSVSPLTASPPSMSPLASPHLCPRLNITPPPSKFDLEPSPRATRSRNASFSASPRVLSPKPPTLQLPEDDEGLEPLIPVDTNASGDVKPWPYWPYRALPPPEVLACTLFPTLVDLHKKRIWEMVLGLATAPSFFLLTITLPVAEPENDRQEEAQPIASGQRKDSYTDTPHERVHSSHPHLADEAVSIEARHGHSEAAQALTEEAAPVTANSTGLPGPPGTREWNRWLVLVQCFTAPQFVVLVIWANLDEVDMIGLAHACLWTLLGSTITAVLIKLTSEPDRPPAWHFLLCFAGFAVSVAWISTIANEVVGVLKAIGVIFNISDAILGLTIFAVGNSLGDLVADITVARLGYPVMALSACFGGPMLNILLGVGISGIFMVIRKEDKRHRKHPGQAPKLKPFHIEVSWTLLISAIGLLITLLALLILVPLNKWRMDRKIGILLVAIWVVATVINVVLEVTGLSGDMSILGH